MEKEIFIYPNCTVCKSSDFKKKFEFKYSSNYVLKKLNITKTPKTKILLCKRCGHYFAQPQIHNKLVAKYYTELNSEFYDVYNLPKKDPLFKEHASIRKLVKEKTTNGKILEIGCGYGFLINGFEPEKWDRFAVEPSPHAANFVQENYKINIQNITFENTVFENNFFDVIMFFDVIEHLHDPQLFFNKLSEIIKPGGFIYIGTGSIRSLNARISGKNWAYFGSWEHISFFSKKSIRFLLNTNDFKLIKIVKRSYRFGIKNYFYLLKNIIKSFLRIFNDNDKKNQLSCDHVTIVAQKIKNSHVKSLLKKK